MCGLFTFSNEKQIDRQPERRFELRLEPRLVKGRDRLSRADDQIHVAALRLIVQPRSINEDHGPGGEEVCYFAVDGLSLSGRQPHGVKIRSQMGKVKAAQSAGERGAEANGRRRETGDKKSRSGVPGDEANETTDGGSGAAMLFDGVIVTTLSGLILPSEPEGPLFVSV